MTGIELRLSMALLPDKLLVAHEAGGRLAVYDLHVTDTQSMENGRTGPIGLMAFTEGEALGTCDVLQALKYPVPIAWEQIPLAVVPSLGIRLTSLREVVAMGLMVRWPT